MITDIRKGIIAAAGSHLLETMLLRYGQREGFAQIDTADRSFIFLDPVHKIEISYACNDPWSIIRTLESITSTTSTPPLSAGFISYEFSHFIEKLPKLASAKEEHPLLSFFLYSTIFEIDKSSDCCIKWCISYQGNFTPLWKMENNIELLSSSATSSVTASPSTLNFTQMKRELEQFSNFTHQSYLDAVNKIKDEIKDGNVYQVNLSQRFKLPACSRPEDFYLNLRRSSPAQRAAYIRLQHSSIVSASPELFIEKRGATILASPIKGTAALDSDPAELLRSPKNLAELAMIVDLIRNDLGRVAKTGSVKVISYPRLETLPHLHHLLADIEAKLPSEVGLVEIVRALFPSGSVTGCPKIAAMKIITELEGVRRGVYTGAIGIFGGDYLHFNVAIRTALLSADSFIFQTGGAVVIDSEPEAEYEETFHKARGIWEAYKSTGSANILSAD